MNPLTNAKNLHKLNLRELDLGLTGTSTSWHSKYKDSAWVHVGGLPYDLTEGDIICVFSQFGEIVNVNLVRDKDTGKSRGFCFICYEDQRSTILAVDNLNTTKLVGRTIKVDHVENYKVPKEFKDQDELTKKLHKDGCAPEVQAQHSPEVKQSGVSKQGPVYGGIFRIPTSVDNTSYNHPVKRVVIVAKKKKDKKNKKQKKVKDETVSEDADIPLGSKKKKKKKKHSHDHCVESLTESQTKLEAHETLPKRGPEDNRGSEFRERNKCTSSTVDPEITTNECGVREDQDLRRCARERERQFGSGSDDRTIQRDSRPSVRGQSDGRDGRPVEKHYGHSQRDRDIKSRDGTSHRDRNSEERHVGRDKHSRKHRRSSDEDDRPPNKKRYMGRVEEYD